MATRKLNPEAPPYYPLDRRFSLPPLPPPRLSLPPPPTVAKSPEAKSPEVSKSAPRRRNRRGRKGASSEPSRFGGKWNPRLGDREKFQKMRRSNRGGVRLAKYEVLPLSAEKSITTVMIKNIPKQYNREILLKVLDDHCAKENSKDELAGDAVVAAYDFVYFPADFSTGNSRGYAFVNFTDPRAVWRFHEAFDGMKWGSKIVKIVCAAIQGKEALVKHFEASMFRCKSDELLPAWFDPPRDGRVDAALVKEIVVGKRVTPPPLHHP